MMTVDEIRSETAKLRQMANELEAQAKSVRQELNHWEEILRMRNQERMVVPQRPLTSAVPAQQPAGDEPGPGPEQKDPYGAKAKALRAFIRAHKALGVSVGEVVAEAVRVGSHPNAGYRFVARLTDAQPPELERRNGRIYPTVNLKSE